MTLKALLAGAERACMVRASQSSAIVPTWRHWQQLRDERESFLRLC